MMKCIRILNYLSIPICLLNVFITSNNGSGLGGLIFEDPDNYWPVNQHHSPTHSNEDYSELFNKRYSHISSEQSELVETSNMGLPSTMNDIEDTFMKLNHWTPLPWKEIEDNDTVLLNRICFAVWPDYISDIKCKPIAKPYKAKDKSMLKVELEVPAASYIKLISANLLRCKCYPNDMKQDQIKSIIKPLYLAKYDNLSVFLLKQKDYGSANRLKIIGMTLLNLTDIISRSSYKPPYRTSSPLVWNLTQTEKEFYILYNNFSDDVKWQSIRDNVTNVLQEICIALWDDNSYKKCHAEPRPYTDPKRNGMKAMLTDNYDAVTVRADFLLCRCSSDINMPMRRIKQHIEPVYFAKYDNTTVFKLMILGHKYAHNLKIINKKALINLTIF